MCAKCLSICLSVSFFVYLDYSRTNEHIYLFEVLHRFQHCSGHIMMGSFMGRGNQCIKLDKDLYCKLPTISDLSKGKKLTFLYIRSFPREALNNWALFRSECTSPYRKSMNVVLHTLRYCLILRTDAKFSLFCVTFIVGAPSGKVHIA